MTSSRARLAVFSTLVLTLLPSIATRAPRASTPPYVVTDLGTLGIAQTASAHNINDAEDVVGESIRAFRWRDGNMVDLGTLSGNGSSALGVNEIGQIVGNSSISGQQGSHAVLWENGTIRDLTPELGPNQYASAAAINESGQVVASITYAGLAFLWQNGVRTDLGHLGGGYSSASDINDAGQVVGSSYTGLTSHPFLWQNGVMTDLGLLPGDEDGGARAINSRGQIIGTSGRTDPDTYETFYRPFIYENGVMTAIPVPSWDSYAGDINDSGVAVGTMKAGGGFSPWHAWIYKDGVVTNLNSLIPSGSGLHLRFADAINNKGQIVGVAFDAQGRHHAYLLTPVAEGTPLVDIGNASLTEGHSGTQSANLTLTLAPASSQTVTVTYTTANGNATAGTDYLADSGTVTFVPGQTTATISLLVNGDRVGEANETFLVNLSQPTGSAMVGDGQGVVTIVDDEPRVRINDVSRNEGQSQTASFVFTVTLSPASDISASVNFATADGSARVVEDYDARSGVLAFNPGETSKTIAVQVRGDKKSESEETFYVNLSGPQGALLADGQGIGVIRNDDR